MADHADIGSLGSLGDVSRLLGGRYVLESRIGSGGHGDVYLSHQPVVDRPVAIKLIRPPKRAGSVKSYSRMQARFLREARLHASIGHPSVVTLYDFGSEDDGTLFIVMEYLEGRSMYEHLGSMPVRHVAHVCVQVLEALHAAHQQGLIHRDIKPENIMILDAPDARGLPQARLLDFGIARSITNHAALTQQGEVFGTPWYMAPEQALGLDNLDGKVDQYAVGVILYEAISGRLPFDGDDPQRVLDQLASRAAPKLRPTQGVPSELVRLVNRAMARKAEDRFASAAEMAKEIKRLPWFSAGILTSTSSLKVFKREQFPSDSFEGLGTIVDAHPSIDDMAQAVSLTPPPDTQQVASPAFKASPEVSEEGKDRHHLDRQTEPAPRTQRASPQVTFEERPTIQPPTKSRRSTTERVAETPRARTRAPIPWRALGVAAAVLVLLLTFVLMPDDHAVPQPRTESTDKTAPVVIKLSVEPTSGQLQVAPAKPSR
ncbi:MAG: serine/threonine-protein kinase [Bradymonadia bacterium]